VHENNVIFSSWFDTAVNKFLIANGVLDLEQSPVNGLVITSRMPERSAGYLKIKWLTR